MTWAVVGAAAAAGVMLKDLGALLGDIQTAASRSYGAEVFTGLHTNPFDTAALRDAIEVWRLQRDVVGDLLAWHVWIDRLVFAPAVALIVWKVLRECGTRASFAWGIAVFYVAVDEVETLVTEVVLRPLLESSETPIESSLGLVSIQLLAFAKWVLLLTAALVTAVALARRRRRDRDGLIATARRGEEQTPAQALGWLIVLTGLFAALVALPAGGPLDQIPDVIRQHLAEGDPGLWALSTLGLVLCFAAVAVAGLAATSPKGRTARDATISSWVVIAVAAAASGLFFVWSEWRDGDPHLGLATPLVVALVLWVASGIASWAGVAPPAPHPPKSQGQKSWTDGSILWTGGLAGVIAMAGALGLVRAAFPPLVLGIDDDEGIPWALAAIGGSLGAILAGGGAQWVVDFVARRSAWLHRVVAGVVTVAVVGLAVSLAVAPDWASSWGSTGVVGAGLGLWALVIGALIWLSRTRPRWDATRRLGFGARTPWFTLLLVVGLVGGALSKDAGYHDARLVNEAYAERYSDLEDAFDSWDDAVRAACSPERGTTVPMVFVAAPGGGIRAAYWTVSVLQSLFPGRCSAAHLFAVSGVSGGSVGATTWVTARGSRKSTKVAVTAMSEDVALPRALAGLLLRDIPQPVTGIANGWDDRAALMERGWTDASGIFGPSDDPKRWSEAGDGDGLEFVPVLTLNGSSVTDACRVLVTNVGSLPASTGPDCQGVPSPGNSVAGPETGTIDAFDGLRARGSADCGETEVDVPITTGALLSARFPFVSPSGVLDRCIETESSHEAVSTYVVDGGYYENSGLLTLLQLWDGLDDEVAEYNAGDPANPVEPWFVLVDNHYRATAKKVPPGSPMELLVPLEGSRQKVLTQTMLEQAAIWEMGEGGGEPRYVYLAPTVRPGVEAPLGWVLSSASRTDLDVQLEAQIEEPSSSLERLLTLLP